MNATFELAHKLNAEIEAASMRCRHAEENKGTNKEYISEHAFRSGLYHSAVFNLVCVALQGDKEEAEKRVQELIATMQKIEKNS